MGNNNSDSNNNTDTFNNSKESLPFYNRDEDYGPLGQKTGVKCTLKNRLIGFAICCAIGWLISFLSTVSLLVGHNRTKFAILYSIGQIFNITGSCFLATPKKQAKAMFKKSRAILTVLYLGAIIVTLILGAFLPQNLSWLVFISLIAQITAYFFYTLSYIPYGQKILKKICRFMID